jgi:hypothetical protein
MFRGGLGSARMDILTSSPSWEKIVLSQVLHFEGLTNVEKSARNRTCFHTVWMVFPGTTVVVDDVVVTTQSFGRKCFILYVPSPTEEELRAVYEYSYCMQVARCRRVRSRVL